MQYASLIALKQKILASAALSVQEIDCFSVPVAVDECGSRDPLHSDSNSEECCRAPVPHRYTQQSSAYNQAVEIGLQPLAHNPTSDLTVTPGEEKTPHLHTAALASAGLYLHPALLRSVPAQQEDQVFQTFS